MSVYTLTVEVSDGITSSRSDVTINVSDIDEQPPATEEDDGLASRSLTDGTEQTTGTYSGSTATSGSGGYYDDGKFAADHGSNDLEYVRAAVTEGDAQAEGSNPEGDPTLGDIDIPVVGDLSVLLEPPAAGEDGEDVAQELSESLQQEADRFEQDRRELIETLDEVSDLLRCG